jgi:hypothetical protein
VLNGASQDAAQVARAHPTVGRIITRDANIGFGAACNLAAHEATGANLIFLNDDTRVDPHWLHAITSAAIESEGCAAVASLLLNPDGSVQEAGSRLLSHGGTVQLGRGLSVAQAEQEGLLKGRAVDYGSAAALLVKRTSFENAGGFDPIFEPAYFEDADLQLRLREAGKHIWFEPSAIVFHRSGGSTSTDRWFRHFAAHRSGQRFVERWAAVLSTAPTAAAPIEELCCVTPRNDRLPTRSQRNLAEDDSAAKALKIARDYEEWLVAKLDDQSIRLMEIAASSSANTRKLNEQIDTLTVRLQDLEHRGPLGVIKMRIGVWANRQRERRGAKRSNGHRLRI